MTVADNLRKIEAVAVPAFERWADTVWCVNLIFMTAFRHGFIDDLWTEFRRTHPNTWLHYFIRARGLGDIKIGKTNQLLRRFDDLRSAISRGADLLACYPAPIDHENELHQDFRKHRINGEWFFAHDDLLDYLRMIGGDVDGFTDIPRLHRFERRRRAA